MPIKPPNSVFGIPTDTKLLRDYVEKLRKQDITNKEELETSINSVEAQLSALEARMDALEATNWSLKVLSSTFSTNLVVVQNITGLSFTPDASAIYAVRGTLLIGGANTGEAPRPSIVWPTVLAGNGSGIVRCTNVLTSQLVRIETQGATVTVANTSLPVANTAYWADIDAIFTTSSSVISDFAVGLRAEAGSGPNVFVYAGSYIRYRKLADV